jgi:hypothetical protein
VYPIVFLYRHHIELALKRVIKRAPYLIERPPTKVESDHLVGHRLDSLWQDFKPMAKAITEAAGWEELPLEDVEGIDDYIRQLCEVDPRSYSLRYAHSTKGDPSLPETLTHINLRHFGELMERLANYLYGLEAATSHWKIQNRKSKPKWLARWQITKATITTTILREARSQTGQSTTVR